MSTETISVIEIDAQRALRLLLHVVSECGLNNVYKLKQGKFRYVWNGAPDDLIAKALHKAGMTVEALETIDTVSAFLYVSEFPGVELTDAAREILASAQKRQDSGAPWGEALGCALSTAVHLVPLDADSPIDEIEVSVVDEIKAALGQGAR